MKERVIMFPNKHVHYDLHFVIHERSCKIMSISSL